MVSCSVLSCSVTYTNNLIKETLHRLNMGSEQSQSARPKPPSRIGQLARGHTIAAAMPPESSVEPTSGNNSPGASVCSDSELPYISYTVDRPIGDSPKMSGKGVREPRRAPPAPQRRQMSLPPRRAPKKAHSIVVVKEAQSTPNLSTDEDVRRLQEIPTFLPIMRGTLGLPGVRDPEVLEGLDYRPWARLASRYQAHLSACVQPVAADQAALTARVKETDAEITRLLAMMVERQRSNARAAERLSRVHDVSRQLTRCHSLLNQAMEGIELLNNMLPVEERLEPFVWTTG